MAKRAPSHATEDSLKVLIARTILIVAGAATMLWEGRRYLRMRP